MSSRVVEQVERWRDQLLDLSKRNPAINFKDLRVGTLEIVNSEPTAVITELQRAGERGIGFYSPPELAEAEESTELVLAADSVTLGQELSPGVRRLARPPEFEVVTSKPTASALRRSLTTLSRNTTQEFLEKGIWTLYLGYGMLEWKDPITDDSLRSPLVFVPAKLTRDASRGSFRLGLSEGEREFNPALALKLEREADLIITEFNLDDGLEVILSEMETLLARQPNARVTQAMVLARFSFQKEVMYKDLLSNAAAIADHPIVAALAGDESLGLKNYDTTFIPEDELDTLDPPEERPTVMDADSSQRQCIEAAVRGVSFVMDGPPGTGKSQTIANMIAELIRVGSKVLFVSEKAAALEVVKDRLKDVGLESYVLDLSDQRKTRRQIAIEIANAMFDRPKVTSVIGAPDVATLKVRREELSKYADAMEELREPLGQSLYTMIGRASQLRDLPQAPVAKVDNGTITSSRFAEILSLAQQLSSSWGPVRLGDAFLWRGIETDRYDASFQHLITTEIDAARAALASLQVVVAATSEQLLLSADQTVEAGDWLIELLQLLQEDIVVEPNWLAGSGLEQARTRINEVKSWTELYHRLVQDLSTTVGGGWRGLDAGRIHEGLEAVERMAPTLGSAVEKLSHNELRRLASLCEIISTYAARMADAGRRAETGLGLTTEELTLSRCTMLAKMGELLQTSHPPLPEWFNPAASRQIRDACITLERLASAVRDRRDELSAIFEDSVVDLDLEGLIVRFTTLHHGLGKLKSSYRADKAVLIPHLRSRKLSLEAISKLSAALQYQQVVRQLRRSESQHAPILGTYYEGTSTDFDVLEEAIATANRAMSLVGAEMDPERLGALFQEMQASLAVDMSTLTQGMQALDEQIEGLDSEVAKVVRSLNIDQLQVFAKSIGELIMPTLDLFDYVQGVSETQLTVPVIKDIASRLDRVAVLRQELDKVEGECRKLLGLAYQDVETDWVKLDAALAHAERIIDVVGFRLDISGAHTLLTAHVDPEALEGARSNWLACIGRVLDHFQPAQRERLSRAFVGSIVAVTNMLDRLVASTDDIAEWYAFDQGCSELRRFNLGDQLNFAISNCIEPDQLTGVIERSLLEGFVDQVMAEDPRLRSHRAIDRDATVAKFRELDVRLFQLGSSRVMEACNNRRPQSVEGQTSVVTREAEKRSRHMPTRDLLAKAGEVIQLVKPCFIMTPLTVSQYLATTQSFDVVIFDEASQVRPADAIGAIYRGARLVVAGDKRQLPPSSFFDQQSSDESDEYEEGQFEDFESVLDLCKGSAGLPSHSLRWHYRSQHESLITYSNYSFYDSRLVTFPSATQTSPDLGIEFFKVKGTYRSGGARDNPVEAEAVIDRLLFHKKAHPHLSVGIVAFSQAQASAIEDALDRRRRTLRDPDTYFQEDRLRGVFIKNLESVQGDERDIIIFSIGYGPNEAGKFSLNLGPLNKEGGERRLNVAITRAKRRVEVVASVTAEDFRGDIRAAGIRHLKRYLAFAENGLATLTLETTETGLGPESPFEEEVARVVNSWGYTVAPQIGQAGYRIDLGVRDPNNPEQFLLGIECDGARYHSSKVARDRDRLRNDVLTGLGWHMHHIWGTAWYRERGRAEAELRQALEAAQVDARTPAGTAVERLADQQEHAPVQVEIERVAWNQEASWIVPYRAAEVTSPAGELEIVSPDASPYLRQMILHIVEREGPILRSLVLKRVRMAWGLGRAGSRVQDAVDHAITRLVKTRSIARNFDGSLSLPGTQLTHVRVPDDDETSKRTVMEVPIGELQLAMINLTRDAGAISGNDLFRSTARVFNWLRLGSEVAEQLELAHRGLCDRGSLRGGAEAYVIGESTV